MFLKQLFCKDEQDELVEKLTRTPLFDESEVLDPLYMISNLLSNNRSDYLLGKISQEEYLATIKQLEYILDKEEELEENEMGE